jgi:hypothetical protein
MARYFDDDDERRRILRDGEKLSVHMTAMGSAAIAADGIPLDYHRPGFRLAAKDARDASERAYAEMISRMQDQWKSPARTTADTERVAEPPLSEDARENAYLQYKKWLANAWRGS